MLTTAPTLRTIAPASGKEDHWFESRWGWVLSFIVHVSYPPNAEETGAMGREI
jgi:hypothetical protein